MSWINENFMVVLTIVGMAFATYLTRVMGFVVLRNRSLSQRALAMMEAAPGCVLISVIAPYFVSDRPADLLAFLFTALLATRLPMLPTVVLAVIAASLLRQFLG